MKKFSLLIFVFIFFILGCASTKILTPHEIYHNIGGLDNLAKCQFFISKDVTLNFVSDTRSTGINERSGVVIAERRIQRKNIVIVSSTPGILQTQNGSGEDLLGYVLFTDSREELLLALYILFEDNDDNAIGFICFYNVAEDKLELVSDKAIFDGLEYKITYSGDERPYLKYKLIEKSSEESTTRKASGRKVGR